MSQQRSDLTHHDASGDKKSRASDSASEQLEKEARIVSGPALEDAGIYKHIVEVFNEACHNYATRSAFTNLGYTITFSELQRLATDFASFLNNVLNLEPGTRVAIQLPNVLQYPIVLFGALKAGMIVINTNPLYTVREMVHQFNDSEAQVLISLVNFGDRIAEAVPKTSIRTVVLSELGDVLPAPKRYVVNAVVRYAKKMVPHYRLPGVITYRKAMAKGRRHRFIAPNDPLPEDTAVLQYTGGTTGVAKGAELTHFNLVSNMLQIRSLLMQELSDASSFITPLPLYHIFSFMANCLSTLEQGHESILITNPRDVGSIIDTMKKNKFHAISAVNTLYVALMNHAEFSALDFSHLRLSLAGGMALQTAVAEKWERLTGCKVYEGFGLTETSPVVMVNQPLQGGQFKAGSVGFPLPGTSIKVIDAQGNALPRGERGELCVKGPQVMKGYLNNPEATHEVIDESGWLHTGDIAIIDDDGYVFIVDRLKDMILVSGFNVYPNEVEDVMASHPGILECAAVGVPDEKRGETVKLFIVKRDPALTEEQVIEFARSCLTAYKVPKHIEFRKELPKSNVGKILRKALRPAMPPHEEAS